MTRRSKMFHSREQLIVAIVVVGLIGAALLASLAITEHFRIKRETKR